jgi:tetratricopeptide (TPR) repeat protein
MESVSRLLNQIIAHYEKKEYQEAEKLVDTLLLSHPEFHRGQFLKAVILEETGRADAAQRHYEKSGNRFTLWARLAAQLHEVDPDRAIEYYERVTKADPQNNTLWFNLGELYEKKGRGDDARNCFKNLSPVKEVLSRILIPLGFMIFLLSGAIAMIQRGETGLAIVVVAGAVFCVYWLKRDARKTVQMVMKKNQAGK